SLLRLIAQARGRVAAPRITLDLLKAGHIDLDGLMPLRHQVDAAPGGELPPVTYRLPDALPVCRRTVPTMPQACAGTGAAADPGAGDGPSLTLLRGAQSAPADAAVGAPLAPAVAPAARPRTRRDEILEGTARMFAEYGYYGASLRDISRHIGISHPG